MEKDLNNCFLSTSTEHKAVGENLKERALRFRGKDTTSKKKNLKFTQVGKQLFSNSSTKREHGTVLTLDSSRAFDTVPYGKLVVFYEDKSTKLVW